MSPKKVSISLTGIMIKDEEANAYTAYFAELPEAVADGNTQEEAETNLFEALKIILDTRKEDSLSGKSDSNNITRQNYELELS